MGDENVIERRSENQRKRDRERREEEHQCKKNSILSDQHSKILIMSDYSTATDMLVSPSPVAHSDNSVSSNAGKEEKKEEKKEQGEFNVLFGVPRHLSATLMHGILILLCVMCHCV